jgi:hypothetical protein
MPFLGAAYILFPQFFTKNNEEEQYEILQQGYSPKVGLPTLLAKFNKVQGILYGNLDYIYS